MDTARKKILFVVFSDSGQLNPMLAIAQEAERRGHETAIFSAQQSVRERVERAGLRAICGDAARPAPTEEVSDVPASILFRRRMEKPAWLKRWLQQVVVDGVPQYLDALLAFIDGFSPDVICINAMAYGGAIAASLRKIPWAAVPTQLNVVAPHGWESDWTRAFAKVDAARAKLGEQHGVALTFDESDVVSPYLNTAFTVDELTPRAENGNTRSHFVGASIAGGSRGVDTDFPWSSLRQDVPLVYVSFGTINSPELETLDLILGALDPDEAQLVVAMKDVLDVNHPLPSNVLAVKFAPQVALLKRARAMVSHGGLNSILEGFSQGVPSLVIPMVYDQPLNAELVRRAGAGLLLGLGEVTRESVRERLLALIQKGSSYSARASELGLTFAKKDGASEIAQLLEKLAETQAPVLPKIA